MDWGGRRKESVIHLGELIDIPDGLIGSAHIVVDFGERVVQVLF